VSTAERSLSEHLEEGHDEERFRVRDKASAEWALRKVAHRRKVLAEEEALYEAERHKLDAWIEERRERAEKDTQYLCDLLEEFHRAQLAEDPKAKTISLPSGKLTARKAPDKWEFDEGFLAWARTAAPELIRTKEEPDRQAAKRLLIARHASDGGAGIAVTPDGELVQGLAILPGDLAFKVEVAGD
jgi:phage host-nuclease inhibitor protein Gam